MEFLLYFRINSKHNPVHVLLLLLGGSGIPGKKLEPPEIGTHLNYHICWWRQPILSPLLFFLFLFFIKSWEGEKWYHRLLPDIWAPQVMPHSKSHHPDNQKHLKALYKLHKVSPSVSTCITTNVAQIFPSVLHFRFCTLITHTVIISNIWSVCYPSLVQQFHHTVLCVFTCIGRHG